MRLAVRNGTIANSLIPVAEERHSTRKKCAGTHKRVHTDSLGDGAAVEAAPTFQQQKKVPRDEESEPKRAKSLSVMPQVQPPAVEVGLRDVKPKRIRGGLHSRGKGGSSAPADSNPRSTKSRCKIATPLVVRPRSAIRSPISSC